MDFMLIGVVLIFCLCGAFRGFVSTIFSLIGSVVVLFLAWNFSANLADIFQNFSAYENLQNTVQNFLNNTFDGTFENWTQFESVLSQSPLWSMFGKIFQNFSENISFEGGLAAGQILGGTISALVARLLAFVSIYILGSLVLKLTKFLTRKLFKNCGHSASDRIFGGLVGAVKGVLVFCVIYFVLVALSNFLLNASFLNFVQSGTISKAIYENVLNFVLSFFL